MRTTRNTTENYARETIDRIVRNALLEMAYNNMTFKEFERDMRALGFVYREAEGSSKVFYIPKYGDNSSFTLHVHDENAKVDGNALRQVKDVLKSIGWFNDPQNYRKFPFKKWGISDKDIVVDKTQEDIEKANEMYKDAEVEQVFPMKNSVCVIKAYDKYNLCRNSNDRRPLLKDWYDEYGYDRKTNSILCLKQLNWERYETECYPIKKDGTLDTENIIIENKRYGKHRIK